ERLCEFLVARTRFRNFRNQALRQRKQFTHGLNGLAVVCILVTCRHCSLRRSLYCKQSSRRLRLCLSVTQCSFAATSVHSPIVSPMRTALVLWSASSRR